MPDLAQKYRPRRFGDVAGQRDAVAWLRRQVVSGEARSVLMSGPIGTGKTTLGLIYSKALFCEALENGEPCDACETCVEFGERGRGLTDFLPFECGERSTVDEVKGLLETATTAPFITKRRVALLDEVHNLSRRAFDALLRIVETPPKWTTFVFLTSKPEAVPPALLSRLTHQELNLLSAQESTTFLSATCQAEGIAYSPEGLMLLFATKGGHPRSMLRGVERVLEYGEISAANVRSAFRLDFLDRLMDFSRALLDKDFRRQLALIEDWADTPRRKLEFLHRFFVFNYFVGIRRLVRDDPLMNALPDEFREVLLDGMAQRAVRLRLKAEDVWELAIAVLEPRDALSDYQLTTVLNDLDRRLNPRAELDSPSVVAFPNRSPAPKLRATRLFVDASTTAPGERLAWSDVEPTWIAASFLPQHYGVLVNIRLAIRHRLFGLQSHQEGATLVSHLTHQLGMRLSEWRPRAGAQFHWMYRHEVDGAGAMLTRLAISVPPDHVEAAINWLRARFFRRYGDMKAAALISTSHGRPPDQAVRFHWRSVRALSRGLDPSVRARSDEDEFRPLVDLLEIPECWRGEVGKPQCGQARGELKSLGPTAQRTAAAERMAFLSALKDKAWSSLDFGWELDEYRDRLSELDRRGAEEDRLRGLFPGDDAFSHARLAEELARQKSLYPEDAKQRLRSWNGWWMSASSTAATPRKQAKSDLSRPE